MHEWTKDELQIIKAAWATDAGRLALSIVVERLAGLHGSTYHDNPQRMAHSEGRRSVGIDLMRAVNLPIEKIIEAPKDDRHGPITATERAALAAAISSGARRR